MVKRSSTRQILNTARQVRQLDQALATARGVPTWQLMQDAAAAAHNVLRSNWPEAQRIIIMTGSGNNAGDGWALASLLRAAGREVLVLALKSPEQLAGDAALAVAQAQSAGCAWHRWDGDDQSVGQKLQDAELIVDALLGTGIDGELRADYVSAVTAINQAPAPVLALDVPTGLQSDTGRVEGLAVQAVITVTFVAYKRGQFTLDGPDHCGQLVLADLGLSDYPALQADAADQRVELLAAENTLASLPQRRRNSHKKTYGHVLVIAGNQGMAGAGLLAGQAALHSGAGLVTLLTHARHASQLHAAGAELMIVSHEDKAELAPELLERADCIVIGPGLGQDDWARCCWHDLEKYLAAQDRQTLPVVVDADGLWWLRRHPLAKAQLTLTPHPGEAAHLLDTNSARIQQDRFHSATELARRYQASVVLKGNGTVLAQQRRLALCPFGNPGMATAGMGDVLAGVCGGLLAQQPQAVFRQVCRAVTAHALAGDLKASQGGQYGLTAGALIDGLAEYLP